MKKIGSPLEEVVVPLLVDLSAVSSVLFTFVALCVAAGAVQIAFWPEGVSPRGRFPFPDA